MNLTFSVFLQTCLAAPVLLLLVLPCGFLLGWASNVMQFRIRSAIEQTLWSVTLSLPASLFIACVLARLIPPWATLTLFVCADAFFFAQLLKVWKLKGLPAWDLDRRARILLVALLVEAVYLSLAGLPIRLNHRIFEPVFSSDWEIRLPLIDAAVRDVLPRNPFSTFHGQSPTMRYYYYWYSLCALVVRITRVGARPALLASSIYSVLAIVSTMLLYLKYMVRSSENLRRRSLFMLGLCCVLGLDVLPNTLGLFLWKVHLQPEVEWWAGDRSPGLPGAVVYAPHHIAGAALGLLAFLLLATFAAEEGRHKTKDILKISGLLAVVFAALVGTSTFICMFFGIACAVLALYSLKRNNSQCLYALALAGLISLTVSAPYLHQLLGKTNAAPGTGHKHFLELRLRDTDFAHGIVNRTFVSLLHKPQPRSAMRFVYRAPLFPLFWLCELGFYLFVIIVQFRHDFRSGYSPSFTERAVWILVGTLGFFFFFVDSTPIQAVNDLGFQAGLVLRLVYILWGAHVLARYLADRQTYRRTAAQRLLVQVATVFLLLGATMTIWQVVGERIYLVLVDRGIVPAAFPFPRAQHLASVYNDIYDAQYATGHSLSYDAVIQSDPVSHYQTIFRLYQQRRQAAGDLSCEGAFGGDPALCMSYVPNILKLFGTKAKTASGAFLPISTAADRRPDAFAFVCHQVGITAFLASRFDPVWYQPDSWVWKGDLLYANRSVRVIRCPAS